MAATGRAYELPREGNLFEPLMDPWVDGRCSSGDRCCAVTKADESDTARGNRGDLVSDAGLLSWVAVLASIGESCACVTTGLLALLLLALALVLVDAAYGDEGILGDCERKASLPRTVAE